MGSSRHDRPLDENRSRDALLWLVAIAVFVRMLDTTIVDTALPAMAAGPGESPLRKQAVVIAGPRPLFGPIAVPTGFQIAFVCLGVLTALSAPVFRRLEEAVNAGGAAAPAVERAAMGRRETISGRAPHRGRRPRSSR